LFIKLFCPNTYALLFPFYPNQYLSFSARRRRTSHPQKSIEYQHAADVFLEIFCNQNIWPSPFAAKVLPIVRDDLLRLSTEVELTQQKGDRNSLQKSDRPLTTLVIRW